MIKRLLNEVCPICGKKDVYYFDYNSEDTMSQFTACESTGRYLEERLALRPIENEKIIAMKDEIRKRYAKWDKAESILILSENPKNSEKILDDIVGEMKFKYVDQYWKGFCSQELKLSNGIRIGARGFSDSIRGYDVDWLVIVDNILSYVSQEILLSVTYKRIMNITCFLSEIENLYK